MSCVLGRVHFTKKKLQDGKVKWKNSKCPLNSSGIFSQDSRHCRFFSRSSSRWYSKNVRKRLRIPRTHSEAGTNRKARRSQWRNSRRTGRASTDRIKRWRWSPCRLLVDSRWLHLSSSQWTSSSTLCAEGTNTPCSTEIRWCNLVHSYWSGRHGTEVCQILGKGFTKFTLLKENLPRDIYGPGGDWQKFKRLRDHVWPEVWSKIGKAAQNREKQEWKNEKPKLDDARRLRGFYSIDPDDEEDKETLQNVKRKMERPMAAAIPGKKEIHSGTRKLVAEVTSSHKVPKTKYGWKVESRESTSQRVEPFPPTITKTTLQAKDILRCSTSIWCTS